MSWSHVQCTIITRKNCIDWGFVRFLANSGNRCRRLCAVLLTSDGSHTVPCSRFACYFEAQCIKLANLIRLAQSHVTSKAPLSARFSERNVMAKFDYITNACSHRGTQQQWQTCDSCDILAAGCCTIMVPVPIRTAADNHEMTACSSSSLDHGRCNGRRYTIGRRRASVLEVAIGFRCRNIVCRPARSRQYRPNSIRRWGNTRRFRREQDLVHWCNTNVAELENSHRSCSHCLLTSSLSRMKRKPTWMNQLWYDLRTTSYSHKPCLL